jgi:F420-dependent oxidoreductase-like protein
VGFDIDPATCRERNASRARPVPETVLDKQITRWRSTRDSVANEGFFDVIINPGPPALIPEAMRATTQAVTAPPGFSFDLVVSEFNFGPDTEATLAAIAQAAESAGFRALWVMDHFRQLPILGRAWDPMLEAYTTLSYLAAKTTNLRLGTMVTGIEHRNVGLLAKIIATLDVLSGGRAECGIGAGWFDEEQAAYGYPVNSNGVRLDRLEEALQALPILFGPGSKSFVGTYVNIPEAMAYPRPLQDRIPILVGVGGERRTLKMVAQYADASNLIDDAETIRHKINVLHQHCADVGRDPAQVAVTTLEPTLHARTGRELADLVEQLRAPNQTAEAFAAQANAGTTTEQVHRFRSLAALGVDRAVIALNGNDGPERVEAFADVIDEVLST